jgi:nucleoside-diphosphate-sugar epimerase
MSVLILGGSRFMGRHIAEQLVAAGEKVAMLNRGSREMMPGVEFIRGDRADAHGLDGLAGRGFDAVVDLSAYQSSWVQDALTALVGRVGHYVFISSGAVYAPQPEVPWAETSPIGPDPAWGNYAIEKVAAEKMLAAASGKVPVTVLRLPFVLGPANYADREAFVFSRLALDRPILLPGGGAAINQYVHAADVARAVVAAIGRPGKGCRTYNVGQSTAIANAGLVALAAKVARQQAAIIGVDAAALGVASPVIDLTDFVFPFPDTHYFLDTSAIAADLGVRAQVSLEATLREFHAWWITQADRAPRTYARESRALAALKLAA